MRKILVLSALIIASLTFAQEAVSKKSGPPEGKAQVGETFGAGVSPRAESTAISAKVLSKKLKKSGKVKDVAVKGKVLEVCDKKGCWITVETENKEKFFVKMKDYGFFMPTALAGKTVVLEGNAEKKVISVDEQKHYAEDAKKSQKEIDAITEPKEEIRFMANGIKVIK